MTLEYSIIAAVIGAIYVIVKNYFPEFPIPADMFLQVALFVLALAGVEIVGRPAAAGIRKAFHLLTKRS